MKFNTAIANLKEMGFVNDRDKIHIAVNRNKSLAPEDRLFDCILLSRLSISLEIQKLSKMISEINLMEIIPTLNFSSFFHMKA